MRVLINAFSARLGGGQTYLLNLLKFLPKENVPEIFVLAADSFKLPTDRSNIKRIHIEWPVENPFARSIWERLFLSGLLSKLEADVLFCPGGIIDTRPPKNCKTATMFRNMIPFDLIQRQKYSFGYMRMRNWILQRVMLKSMLQANLVIFVSEFAKKVIEKHTHGLLKETIVIPHGISPHFRVSENNNLSKPDWLPTEGYLLYVSILDFYKAQVEVVQGYALLKQRRKTKEKLVLVGPENSVYGRKVRVEINRLGLKNDVILAGSIPYGELPAVYHHALINIFASESENCPNILLEALAAGRPLVISNRPPMPEFGGDAVIYFDPSSPEELAEKLAAVIDKPAYIEELSFKARKRSLLYDWATTARLTWDAIERLYYREVCC
jgi:glycosyltransferase involved in cell wall biosynthesis